MRNKLFFVAVFLIAVLSLTGCGPTSSHQCHYSSAWENDTQYHWHVCTECNKAGEKSDHRWGSGVVTTPATEIALGVMTYTCLDCGYKKEADIPKIEHITHNYDQKVVNDLYLKSGATCDSGAVYYYSCVCGEKGSNTFVFGDGTGHTFSKEWSYDETAHWHVATCGHDDQVSSFSAHQWNGGIITKQPSETEEGEKTFTCIICKSTKTESVPKPVHTHTYAETWTSDDTYHWHASTCGHESEINGKEAHSWDKGVILRNATETEVGLKVYTCIICGKTKNEEIPTPSHVHTYDEKWTSDETYHWHASACGHESEISGKAEHSWNNGIVTKNPSESESGIKKFECQVCGTIKEEEIAPLSHTHTYLKGWTSDETYHWHASACGHESEISGKAEHSWDDGVVTKNATETETGIKTYTCEVCEATKTEVIPKKTHVHTYSSTWSADETYHWHASTCGHESEISGKAEHSWDDGVVTRNATETETGLKTYTCEVCKKTKAEIIPVVPHVHSFSSEWSYDDDTHWHSATCEHVTIKNDEGTHQWVDTGRVVTEATEFIEGEKEQKCSVCNKTRVIKTGYASHVHTYDTKAWTSDSEYHWHASTCGHSVVSDKSTHTWDAGTIDTQATVYDEGIMIYKCTVCGLEKEESIPELESFTVVFLDKDNRTLSERNYALKTSNKDVKLPTTIQLDGYYFNGWFEISTTVNVSAFDFSTATNNQIYYFKAEYEKQYTVLFEDYLGNQLASIVVTESKNSIAEKDCPSIPPREGFKQPYWDMQMLRDIGSNMTILPIYEELTLEVVFKDKDGNVLSYTDANGNVIKKQIVPYGSFAIEPEYEQYYLDKSEMKFYEFKEWSADFSKVKSNLEIVAVYDIFYDKPVIAAKMNGTTLSMSILLPNNETNLYCLNLSFGWAVDKGTCSISNAILRSESPLDEMNEQGHICTVGQKEDWLKYNNKTHTFDFVWNCGEGHAPNNTHRIDNIIVLTFNVDDGAKFDESIFAMTDNSVIIYGDINDEITNLKTIKPILWFYE